MKNLIFAFAMLGFLTGCSEDPAPDDSPPNSGSISPQSNILSLEIDGWSFVGPNEISSGWTTIRLKNDSGMTHFGLLYRLPDGVSAQMVSDQVVKPIQESLTASLEGDLDKAGEIAKTIPAWIGELVYLGGPGMISDGVTGEATMFLEPGNYVIECYVKTNGMQHNYNPDLGEHGMVLPLTVTEQNGGMSEPDANVTLELSNAGYEISDGEFTSGENSVRINFVEQKLYNNFVGHDAHLFAITPETDVEASARWVDFFPMDGQQTPAPARFVGGIHDMPEGSTAYFKVTLEKGEYGIVAEVPNAREIGLFKTFSVAD
jgi:hypothetical protein